MHLVVSTGIDIPTYKIVFTIKSVNFPHLFLSFMACQFATTYNPRINSKADTLVKIFYKRLGNIGLKGTYCPLPL